MQSGNYPRDEDLQNLSEHHRGFSLKNHLLICKLKGTEESNNEVGEITVLNPGIGWKDMLRGVPAIAESKADGLRCWWLLL